MNIDELSQAIMKELNEYSEEIDETLQNGIDRISQEIKDELSNDPIIPKNRPKYKNSFYVKKIARGKGFKRNVVANKEHQLTHLLEKGHATKGGTDRTRKFPHWAAAQERLEEKMDELENEL